MSTATLSRASLFAFSTGFGLTPVLYRKDNGSLKMERVAVFRSGTFRDSAGIQATYEKLHIDQLVGNFNHLKDSGIFPDVPVRDGHPSWLVRGLPGNGKVVGYHDKVWTENLAAPHDGQNYDYVLTDMNITDPEAARSIENGTWRNRSAEIISYLSNTEAEYWPVLGGVAWVDIPAVEGLKFQSSNVGAATGAARQMYVFMEKETGVGAEPNTTTAPQPSAAPAPALLGVTPPAQVYSVNGSQVTDPAAVQAHITSLEMFRAETVEAGRKSFVSGLAAANKILASQVEGLEAFATSLTPDQFTAWSKTFDAAPVQPALANHAAGVTNPGNAAQQPVDEKAMKLDTAREIVANHRRAAMPAEQIKQTKSYKALVAAGETPDL
jgi:hypothetical protein